jgi:hypothetical protein
MRMQRRITVSQDLLIDPVSLRAFQQRIPDQRHVI